MQPERISAIFDFLRNAERLKDTLRTARTAQGRVESTAEHSWRLCLLVLLVAPELNGVDLLKLLKLCIVHDLGEAIAGDTPAIHQRPGQSKAASERRDLETLCAPLPADLKAEMLALWDEYEAARSPEAVMAKGLDKIETMLQHVHGRNAADFDYAFNLTYGTERTDKALLLRALRAKVDALTRAEMKKPPDQRR